MEQHPLPSPISQVVRSASRNQIGPLDHWTRPLTVCACARPSLPLCSIERATASTIPPLSVQTAHWRPPSQAHSTDRGFPASSVQGGEQRDSVLVPSSHRLPSKLHYWSVESEAQVPVPVLVPGPFGAKFPVPVPVPVPVPAPNQGSPSRCGTSPRKTSAIWIMRPAMPCHGKPCCPG